MSWQPHVTVATIIERKGQFLLVEEISKEKGQLVFNQPAGHLEANETLQEAAIRETFEETGWHIELQGLVGIALYQSPLNGVTYHRTTFFGSALRQDLSAQLDAGIHRAVWMSYEEMLANSDKMRSELVIRAVEQYRNGHQYPLSLIYQ